VPVDQELEKKAGEIAVTGVDPETFYLQPEAYDNFVKQKCPFS